MIEYDLLGSDDHKAINLDPKDDPCTKEAFSQFNFSNFGGTNALNNIMNNDQQVKKTQDEIFSSFLKNLKQIDPNMKFSDDQKEKNTKNNNYVDQEILQIAMKIQKLVDMKEQVSNLHKHIYSSYELREKLKIPKYLKGEEAERLIDYSLERYIAKEKQLKEEDDSIADEFGNVIKNNIPETLAEVQSSISEAFTNFGLKLKGISNIFGSDDEKDN